MRVSGSALLSTKSSIYNLSWAHVILKGSGPHYVVQRYVCGSEFEKKDTFPRHDRIFDSQTSFLAKRNSFNKCMEEFRNQHSVWLVTL